MLSITLRLMRKNLRMLIPAAVAILIGTAFIASTFLFSNALSVSLERQYSSAFGAANYLLSHGAQGSGELLTADSLHLQKIESLPGVRGLRPDYSTMVELRQADASSQQVVLPMPKRADLLPLGLSQGRWPKAAGEIAIPREAAKRLGVSLGQSLTAKASDDAGAAASAAGASAASETSAQAGQADPDQTATKGQPVASGSSGPAAASSSTAQVPAPAPPTVSLHMKIVGYTTDSSGVFGSSAGASVMAAADFATVCFQPGDSLAQLPVDQVYLLLDPANPDEVARRIQSDLPTGFRLQSRQAVVNADMGSMMAGMNPVTISLLTFGILALFVAGLVIANTFQVLIAQRRRTLALLRTVGARRGQVYRSVLFEGFLLGLVSSILGIACGIGLIALLGLFRLSLGGDSQMILSPSPEVFWVPLLFGVVMTVLACLGSARSATRVSPLEALRPIEVVEKSTVGPVRRVFGVIFILVGLALGAVSLQSTRLLAAAATDAVTNAVSQGYVGAILMAVVGCMAFFVGLLLLAAWWMPLLMRGFGALVAHTGPVGVLAHGNVQKNPRRVAATGTALLIGVTLVTTLATGASSAKQTFDNKLSGSYSVDMTITQGSDLKSALPAIKKVSGIADAALLRTADVTLTAKSGKTVSALLVAIDQAQARRLIRADIGGGLAQGKLIVSSKMIEQDTKNPLSDGMSVRVSAADDGQGASASASTGSGAGKAGGNQAGADGVPADAPTLQVHLANFAVDSPDEVTALVSPAFFTAHQKELSDVQDAVWARVTDSAQPLQTLSDVQDVMSKKHGGIISGPFARRVQWNQSIDMSLALLVGLLAVAVVIALIGVANTLSLSVIERTRELATLRAIGMTKGQLRTSLALEAVVISVVSTLVGLVLGTVFGWLGSTVVLWTVGQVSFAVSWGMDALILVIAVLAALVSSVAPARRAVRTAPVEALAEA